MSEPGPQRRLPVGAEVLPGGGTHFRVWAPRHDRVEDCLGSISEIFDAEAPYYPRGYTAQAWSVAEVLRCWVKTMGRPVGPALTARPRRSG